MTANGAQYGIPTAHYYWIGAVPAMVFLGIVMMPFYYGSKARSVPEFLAIRFNRTTQRVQAVVVRAGLAADRGGQPVRARPGARGAARLAAVGRDPGGRAGGAQLHVPRRAVGGDLQRGAAVLRHPGAAHPGHRRRAGAGRRLLRSGGEGHRRPGRPGAALVLAGHPDHGDRQPVPVGVRHRLRARVRALLRLLDHELRRGPARALGQEHERRADDPDHRGLPQDAGPAGHRHPRHGRRGADPAAGHAQGGRRDGRHLQQHAVAADEGGPAQRRARRGDRRPAGGVHGRHGRERQLVQHGVHLRHLAGLGPARPGGPLLPQGRPGGHRRRAA